MSSDLEKELEKELSLRNFTPLICVVLFAVLVEYAKNSKDFIILLEAAFVILSFGTLFFFWTSRRAVTKIRRIILNAIAVFSIIIIVFTAYSIAVVPRGGVNHSNYVMLNDMEFVLEKAGTYQEGVKYVDRGEQVLFEADYPISHVRAWYDFYGRVLTQANYNLSGTMFIYLILRPNRITGGEIGDNLIYFLNVASVSHNGTESHPKIQFFTDRFTVEYGLWEPKREMRLEKGYAVTLALYLELYGQDYGESINTTVQLNFPGRAVNLYDEQVTSSLQDMLMISVASFMAGLFIPYRLIMTKKEETPTAESPELPQSSVAARGRSD